MISLRRIVARTNPAASAFLHRPIHSTSTLRNAAASQSDIYSKLNDGERAIYDKLMAQFGSKTLDVVDVSGKLEFVQDSLLFLSTHALPVRHYFRRMWIILCYPYFLAAIQGPVDNQAAQACQPVFEGGGESYSRSTGMWSPSRSAH